mgnify:CR=1 FL=1|jgi:replicative DNA helicase
MIQSETNIPNNTDAERQLLSSFLLDDGAANYDQAAAVLESEDFYSYPNQLIFRAMHKIVEEGDCIDEITLQEQLKKDGLIDEVGGLMGMFDLVGYTGICRTKFCVSTIKEKSNLRKYIRKFKQNIEDMQSETKTSQEVSIEVENLMLSCADASAQDKTVQGSIDELKEDFNSMLDGSYTPYVIKSHIDHLDDKLSEGGIGMGEVMVVAAPTSCGKSQLALNIATRCMQKQKIPTLIFSLEMPQKQVIKRIVHSVSGINPRRIRERLVRQEERILIDRSIEDVESLPLYTSHSVKSIDDLIIQSRTMKRKHGIGLVVIDYLQLIPWNSNKSGKTEAISEISHKIKQMAIELDVAVMLLSQVNREGSKADSLQLYHLRDSGDIENDADIILMMYPEGMSMDRASQIDKKGEYKNMIYNIGKNREGERDIIGNFKFYAQFGRFF